MKNINNNRYKFIAILLLQLLIFGCNKITPIYSAKNDSKELKEQKCIIANIFEIKITNKKREFYDAKMDLVIDLLRDAIEKKISYIKDDFSDCLNNPNILLLEYDIIDKNSFMQKQMFAARSSISIKYHYQLLRLNKQESLYSSNGEEIVSYLVPTSAYASLLIRDDLLYHSLGNIADNIVSSILQNLDN